MIHQYRRWTDLYGPRQLLALGKLLRAIGFAETVTVATKVEYTLIDSAFESAAFYINVDGVLHKGMGLRGTGQAVLDAKGIPVLRVELTALYTAKVDAAPAVGDRTGWPMEEAVNSANTQVCKVNAVDSFYSKFGFSLGNQVSHDIYGGGYQQIKIGDRQPAANITMLAELLATFDPYALAVAGTNIAVQVIHGSAAGKKVQVDMKAIITNVNETDINSNVGYDLTLSPVPVTGNDEIKLTFI